MLPPEHAPSAVSAGIVTFSFEQVPDRRPGRRRLQAPSLLVEPLDRGELFRLAEFGPPHSGLHNLYRVVVDLGRDRERMPVLAAVGERVACRITEAAWRAVDDLGDHRERAHRPRAD